MTMYKDKGEYQRSAARRAALALNQFTKSFKVSCPALAGVSKSSRPAGLPGGWRVVPTNVRHAERLLVEA